MVLGMQSLRYKLVLLGAEFLELWEQPSPNKRTSRNSRYTSIRKQSDEVEKDRNRGGDLGAVMGGLPEGATFKRGQGASPRRVRRGHRVEALQGSRHCSGTQEGMFEDEKGDRCGQREGAKGKG